MVKIFQENCINRGVRDHSSAIIKASRESLKPFNVVDVSQDMNFNITTLVELYFKKGERTFFF